MSVRTVSDKNDLIKQRAENQKKLGKHIDRVINDGKKFQEAETMGCGGRGLCPSLGRGVARMLGINAPSTVSTQEIEAVPVGQQRVRADMASRVFGVATAKKTPALKLEQASSAMRKRVEVLEARSAEHREAAARAMKAGQKATAVRELKKSKMIEKQAVSTQSALDAIEAQSDMLEQTALQREVAAALGATAKSLKKDKNMLSKAEDAVEAASEMRDLHEDLSHAMSGLGDTVSNDYDDDELMAELQGMIEPPAEESAPKTTQDAKSASRKAEKEALKHELQRAEYEALERMRQQLPSAPTTSVPESTALLASQ